MLYAGYVLRSLRDFLDYLRTSLSKSSGYEASNGNAIADAWLRKEPFTRFTPPLPQLPPETLIYSARTRSNFAYSGKALPPYQTYYLRKMFEFLKTRHVRLVFLNIPEYDERGRDEAVERLCWPDVLGSPSAMIGVPPAVLFGRLTDADIQKLYYDNVHLNRNGGELFTRTILPALLELYANGSRFN